VSTRNDIAALARRLGYDHLREGQEEAVRAVLEGRDLLAVMPTGHGKSAVHQIAALGLGGVTVVVTPLIALQWDQVQHLEDEGAPLVAVAVNSAQSAGDNAEAWRRIEDGRTAREVYLAPEQLANDEVLERLAAVGVTQFVVDEAHCVSAWGHDFRPDYLRLGEIADRLGHPPVVALTATGSSPVRDDILEKLHLRRPEVLVSGFDRPNLHLAVVRHENDAEKRRAVLDQVASLDVPGLLYVATRRETEEYAEGLRQRGRRAEAFHGGLRASVKEAVYEGFHSGAHEIIVATSAFGMGIDKADIRFVVHADIPDSVDSYYQEIGRAGRDGEPAETTLHYRQEDLGLRSFFAASSPDPERLRVIVDALEQADRPVTRRALTASTGLPARAVTQQLNLLTEAGAVTDRRAGVRLAPGIGRRDAVQSAVEAHERRGRIEHSRLDMMRQYAETTGCRRRFVLNYFGDATDEDCGHCDLCEARTAGSAGSSASASQRAGADRAEDEAAAAGRESAAADGGDAYTVDQRIRHRELGEGTVVSVEDDRITVFFEEEGYTVLSKEVIRERDLVV
jgi:ATP-dependent DNA helicase RecQ